ncbi:MAG TPA: MBL fold metallo-hydrolase [Longimicrobiales bacterium]|nr:MBL fold metallo-hydrolase [Longimicrobiales bacterium]
MAGPLTIRTFTSNIFGQNAYLVRCDADRAWVAIDPGGEAGAMAAALEAADEPLAAIVLTHAHIDHLEGVAELAERFPAPIHLHPGDRPLYDAAPQQAAMFGLTLRTPPPPDAALGEDAIFRFGTCALEVRHVPGHSPGHVLLYSAPAGAAFVGDVIFAGSIGRTDLPGGDLQQLMRSIRERVLTLPDETALYSGHGPVTTVARERATNPFLVPHFGGSRA